MSMGLPSSVETNRLTDENKELQGYSRKSSLMSHFPPWFIAAFATIYLCGYLIEVLFYSYFGIVDTDIQLLKMNYIATGSIFVLTFLLIFCPCFFYIANFRAMFANVGRPIISNVVLALIGTIWPLSAFAVTMFSPVWFLHSSEFHRVLIIVLFPLSLILYMTTATIISHKWFDKWKNVVVVSTCGLIVTAICVCDYYIFRDIQIQINKTLTIFFVLFVGVSAFTAKRLSIRLNNLSKTLAHSIEYIGFVSAFGLTIVVCLFLSIFTYAYGIFPIIPNAKGGADYTFAPRLTITLKDTSGNLRQSGLIQIYAASYTIYVAVARLGNDACSWRKRKTLPTIIEFMRNEIKMIEITPLDAKSGETNCVESGP